MTQTNKHSTCIRGLCGLFLSFAVAVQAAISVNPGGTGTLTFDTLPTTDEFVTGVLNGTATTFLDATTLDAAVSGVDVANVTRELPTSGTVPPGTFSGGMRYNTSALYIQSRPTTDGTNAAGMLVAKLLNNIGDDASAITISYTFGMNGGTSAELPGFNVYYSLSGAPGSWQPIAALTANETVGTHTANVPLSWPIGSTMYLLWADDNADGISDPSYTIDNFVITATPATVTAINITAHPQNDSGDERGTASFSVTATGSPQYFQWFRGGVAIDGANSATYTIPSLTYPGDDGAIFHVVVSNSLNAQTSSSATLSVTPDTIPPTAIDAVSSASLTTVTVTFSEPMNESIPGAFGVFPTGTNPDDTSVFPDNSVITGSNAVLTFNTPLTAGQSYSVRIFDVFDTAGANPPGNLIDPYPTVIPLRPTVLLIGFDTDNIWKYDVNTDRTGTGWETVGYDDSLWASGPAGLGLDVSANGVPINTVIPYNADSAPSYYRRTFFLPSPTNGVELSMRNVFEDGAVIYINGQEVFRQRVNPGDITFASRASGNAPDPTPIEGPFVLPATNLVAGENTIAVLVLQAGGTSSDVEMALELTAVIPEFASGPPSIVANPVSQSVNEGDTVSFSVSANGALPLEYHWRRNGVDLANDNSAIFTIVGVLPSQAGTYDVIVSNSISTATSGSATLTVNPDNIAPVFELAVGSTNLTNITLTITDAFGLNQTLAEDESNYTVQLAAGGGALTIESAVLVNNTNVLLTTSPRTQSQDYVVTLGNIRDRSEAANLVTPLTRPLLAGIVILAPDDSTVWRFDNSSNNLDGLGWELPAYDDSGWLTGLAGFANRIEEVTPAGFELRTITLVPIEAGGTPTVYFRVPFNFPGNPATAQLRLVGVVDDGLVAYINGAEAGRIRITNDAPVSFNAFTDGSSPESGDVHGMNEVLLNTSALVQGNNLLAIQLHQVNTGSSDVVLSIQLVGEISEFTPVGPALSIVRDAGTGQVTISWSGSGFTLQETDALAGGSTVWVNSARQNGVPFTPPADNKFYRLVQ